MKAIIAGGRDFDKYFTLEKVSNSFRAVIDEVVSGDARGADTLGAVWANANNIKIKHFRPDWDYYGHAAGFIRNAEMGEYADFAICFWDGKSKGTEHMIKTMKRLNKPYYVYDYNGNEIMKGG